jgi:hypothetical protein
LTIWVSISSSFFSLSLSAFAAETALVYELDSYLSGADPVKSDYTLQNSQSYNDEDTYWLYDFAGEDYLEPVSVSNTDDFSIEPDGTMVEMPGCYDDSEDAFVFKTNTLESYVFADRALVNP